jgi:hypothetical protein
VTGLNNGMVLNKYVISLTREGRVKNLYREVEQILRETPSIEILEGAGLKVFTVAMPDAMLAPLTARLRFANVSPYQELELLSGSR